MGWTDTSLPFHTEATALNKRYRTPHMERLASQGVMFTQAYASAVCSPSRISLMTGMNEVRHGVTNWTLDRGRSPDPAHPRIQPPQWPLNGLAPDAGIERTVVATTLPALLRGAGYRTIHVGKGHFGANDTPGADPANLGFDVNIAGHAAGGPGSYLGTNNFSAAHRNGRRVWDVPGLEQYHGQDIYLSEALTIETLKATQAAVDDGQPFYLYLSHYAVHAPWEADKRFLARYEEMGLNGLPAAYASMIESVDKSLGDVLQWLADAGLDDNTLVIFMSDNGVPQQCPRNLPLRGHKLTPYEGGVRVPMVVRWPGYTSLGTRQSAYLKIEDLFPTILSAAGVTDPQVVQEIDGESFLPLLDTQGDTADADRELVWHFPHTYNSPPWSMIRKGDWKLIWFYADQRIELYNITKDIEESRNLAEQQPEVAAELSSALHEQLVEMGARIPIDKRTGLPFGLPPSEPGKDEAGVPEALSDEWEIVGEAINEPGYHVWGSSPVVDDEGKVHLFAARWPVSIPFDPGWRITSEIARYVGDGPRGPFRFVETVVAGDGEGWDAQGIHNPNIQRVGDRYVLTYIANPGGWTTTPEHTRTQRIGMLIADSLDGPWKPANGDPDRPMLAPPDDPEVWCHGSSNGVNNPALLVHPDGRFLLYFKAMSKALGHAQMGVAIADKLEGPYVIQKEPITANNRTIEDGYAFLWRDHVCLITTDNYGILEEGGGLLWSSRNGVRFGDLPRSAFHHFGRHYFPEGLPRTLRWHYGPTVKFERPQVLMVEGEPAYLYAPSGYAIDGSDGTNCYVLQRRGLD